MDANDFLGKIKANGDKNDQFDLSKVYTDYKSILTKIKSKERGIFSLNVLCLLCRNLDKVPLWRDSVDCKELLILSIDCIRETRGLNKPELVKTLACITHIHRHVVRKNTSVPPELVLKLSFMAFEADLLNDYYKTYWNLLADRLSYIERLKDKSTHKLIPKLTEDLLNTIKIYNTSDFCTNILVFLVKKLHFMFSETYSVQLNVLFEEVFKKIASKNDLAMIKKLGDKEHVDLYKKFCDCLYVIVENGSKNHFKGSVFSTVVRVMLSILGHKPEIFHCLQTFFLNGFCDIFDKKTLYTDAVFKNLTISCEITEKLGYESIMIPTYGFLNQFLRLFIEYSVNNSIKSNFSVPIQENCLNFMLKIISKVKYCEQIVKCENCKVKSGYHDALRLSFLVKHFIKQSITHNIDVINLITSYNKLITEQYNIMAELKHLKCVNHEKCFRKLQTDTHNTAILLNKHQKYEFSIQLFEIYIKNELSLNTKEVDFKNVARAFYNKSICELDYLKHENALIDGFLSLIFSGELSSEKYMSLVMDIKAKALKLDEKCDEIELNNDLQMISVLQAFEMALENNFYDHLKLYSKNIKFSKLLIHEFEMYAKLWPSIMPIAGVWNSLNELLKRQDNSIKEEESDIFWTLLEVISLTPSAVRTIHSDQFKQIVGELMTRINKIIDPVPADIKLVQCVLLLLQAEYDLADASVKYNWKISEVNIDLDNTQMNRTLSQEFDALQRAFQAVELLTELASELNNVTKSAFLHRALRLSEVFVQQLLNYKWTAHGLQLAHICCELAQRIDDKECLVRNAGILLYNIASQDTSLQNIMTAATQCLKKLVNNIDTIEIGIIFLCDAAMYYKRLGNIRVAASLLQQAQIKILKTYNKHTNINLDLAMGRVLEAQNLLCPDSGINAMTAISNTHRHYLAIGNTANKWLPRRLRSSITKYHTSVTSSSCSRLHAALRVRRRARAVCAAALPALCAAAVAAVYTDTLNVYHMEQTQVKIDNRLKYIIGLQTLNDEPISPIPSKIPSFVPKLSLETMRESFHKTQLSPTRKYISIPGYRLPGFFIHKNCTCFACNNVYTTILTYITSGLEAKMYYRGNEIEIASNYFRGVINSFCYFDEKVRCVVNNYSELDFQSYIIKSMENEFRNEFSLVKLDVLIEAAYFELSNKNFGIADDYIVTIHEILQENVEWDTYLKNEVLNLLIASAKVRCTEEKQTCNLEAEFENLKLSPKILTNVPKTPENKTDIPQFSVKKVKDDEIPKKRKVIKLNLDKGSSDEKEEKPRRKPVKTEFKIPVPILQKPVTETITPRPSRRTKVNTETPKAIKNRNPEIVVTDTATPLVEGSTEFFTPQSTPDQFFTPLNTMKTYSKSLRRGIVKNLEEEFSTPKVEKENNATKNQQEKLVVASQSGRKREKATLRRALSPGKLMDSNIKPRSIRQPKLKD